MQLFRAGPVAGPCAARRVTPSLGSRAAAPARASLAAVALRPCGLGAGVGLAPRDRQAQARTPLLPLLPALAPAQRQRPGRAAATVCAASSGREAGSDWAPNPVELVRRLSGRWAGTRLYVFLWVEGHACVPSGRWQGCGGRARFHMPVSGQGHAYLPTCGQWHANRTWPSGDTVPCYQATLAALLPREAPACLGAPSACGYLCGTALTCALRVCMVCCPCWRLQVKREAGLQSNRLEPDLRERVESAIERLGGRVTVSWSAGVLGTGPGVPG